MQCTGSEGWEVAKFWSGFIIGIIVIVAAAYSYIHFGYINPRADTPPSSFEKATAMPALDAAVGRRAPKIKNPVAPTEENLIAGMKVYQANCSLCHGDILHPTAALASSLSPRAPQFLKTAPDMADNQNYYIIQHGIRWSGMPAWAGVLTTRQMWEVTAFLGRMNDLPGGVAAEWRVAAGAAPENATSPPPAKP